MTAPPSTSRHRHADPGTVATDPGMVRAGAAAAARRRELDISQRSLAAEGIINAGALISFEKGRSWPRDKTRAKLEDVLRWPPGTIDQIRSGAPAARTDVRAEFAADAAHSDEGSLISEAVVAAVNALGSAIAAVPAHDHPEFIPRLSAILADLRQLEGVATRATKIGRVTPALIRALSAVRGRIDDVTLLAATSPDATLGQRLYAARRRANLTIAETARAAGVAEEDVVSVESERAVTGVAADLLEGLLGQLD